MSTPAIILGIDPGSRKMGYGLLEYCDNKVSYLESGCIQSRPGSLANLFLELQSIIKDYRPTEASIEQIFMHRNARSSLILGQARGIALLALEIAQLPIADYAPRQIKQAITGYGAASKTQMQYMIQQLLQLSALPSVDAADALSIALCHIHHRQYYDKLS